MIGVWLLAITACGHTPKYKLDTVQAMTTPSQYGYLRVAVAFTGKKNAATWWGIGKINNLGAAKMVAEHFKKTKIFRDAEAVDEKYADLSVAHQAELKARGFDAIFIGEIKQYEGRKELKPGAKVLAGAGIVIGYIGAIAGGVGALIGYVMIVVAISTKGDITGNAAMEVEIKNIEDYSVIWQGQSSGIINQKAVTTTEARGEAFKEAVNNIIERMNERPSDKPPAEAEKEKEGVEAVEPEPLGFAAIEKETKDVDQPTPEKKEEKVASLPKTDKPAKSVERKEPVSSIFDELRLPAYNINRRVASSSPQIMALPGRWQGVWDRSGVAVAFIIQKIEGKKVDIIHAWGFWGSRKEKPPGHRRISGELISGPEPVIKFEQSGVQYTLTLAGEKLIGSREQKNTATNRIEMKKVE